MRRGSPFIILSMLVLIGAAIHLWKVKFGPEYYEQCHLDAMKEWPILVQKGLKGEHQHYVRTFSRCFRVGDPVTKYSTLLASATHMDNSIAQRGDKVVLLQQGIACLPWSPKGTLHLSLMSELVASSIE